MLVEGPDGPESEEASRGRQCDAAGSQRPCRCSDIKVRLDDALEALDKAYPERLRGLLPRIYAGLNLPRESVTGIVNLFSKDVFRLDHGGEDLIGQFAEGGRLEKEIRANLARLDLPRKG